MISFAINLILHDACDLCTYRNDLNRDCLINSESAKILEMTHLNNDETGNDSRRKQLLCEELKGRDGEEGTVASSDNTSHDVKNSEDVSGISARHSVGISNSENEPIVIPVGTRFICSVNI